MSRARSQLNHYPLPANLAQVDSAVILAQHWNAEEGAFWLDLSSDGARQRELLPILVDAIAVVGMRTLERERFAAALSRRGTGFRARIFHNAEWSVSSIPRTRTQPIDVATNTHSQAELLRLMRAIAPQPVVYRPSRRFEPSTMVDDDDPRLPPLRMSPTRRTDTVTPQTRRRDAVQTDVTRQIYIRE